MSQAAARLERLPVSWLHYRLLLLLGLGWLFDAMDVGLITFVLAVLALEWTLSPLALGLIGSAGLVGMFVGAAAAGLLADALGRKTVFQLTLLFFSLATLVNALAWDVPSLLLFRFLVGLGLGGELPVVATLLTELVPSQARGRFLVLLESFWAYGWLCAAVIAFVVMPRYGWRAAFVLGALPALYVWWLRRRLPESPRWLESQGRQDQAGHVLAELEREAEQLRGHLLQPPSPLPAGTVVATRSPLKALWAPRYRTRTGMLWILWFSLVFGYYGIFVWLPTLLVQAGFSVVTSFGYVVLITLAQVPGYFSAAALVDRFGRRPVVVGYLLLSALAAWFYGRATSVAGVLFFGSWMSFFNLGAWGAVYAYTPELYPTSLRATGAGVAAAFGRLGGILAPTMVGWLLPVIKVSGVFGLNAAMFVLAAVAVVLLGPETKHKVLEEIAG